MNGMNQPLVYLQIRMVYSRVAKTMEDLSNFDYVIEYLPGEQNGVANLIFRFPGDDNWSGE